MKRLRGKRSWTIEKINCRRVQNMLSEYIDAELKQGIKASIEEHLINCADCRREYETLILSQQIIKRLKVQDPLP